MTPVVLAGLLAACLIGLRLATPTVALAQETGPTSYTVRPGDSLATIAERAYGSSAEWPRIYEANRDRISDPDWIYPGQPLTLAPPMSVSPVPGSASSASAVEPAADTMYVVRPGDSLATIAERAYGSSAEWPRIYEANRDRISDPTRIYRRQVLRLPAPADSVANPSREAPEAASSPLPSPEADIDRSAAEPEAMPTRAPRSVEGSDVEANSPAAELHSAPTAEESATSSRRAADNSMPDGEDPQVAANNWPPEAARSVREDATDRQVDAGSSSHGAEPTASSDLREAEPTDDTTASISGSEGSTAPGSQPVPDVVATSRPAEVRRACPTISPPNRGGMPVGRPTGPGDVRTESGAAGAPTWTTGSTGVPTAAGGSGRSPVPGRTGTQRSGVDPPGVGRAGASPRDGAGAGGMPSRAAFGPAARERPAEFAR